MFYITSKCKITDLFNCIRIYVRLSHKVNDTFEALPLEVRCWIENLKAVHKRIASLLYDAHYTGEYIIVFTTYTKNTGQSLDRDLPPIENKIKVATS